MKSRSSSIQRENSTEKPDNTRTKWGSALRVVTAVTRLKNLPTKNPPRVATLISSRTQRLGSQPTLLYSSTSGQTQFLKPQQAVGGTPASSNLLKGEKMPMQLEDSSVPNQEHIPRQQRRSQPSIFSTEMHPQLIAAKSGPLGHSQPMLYYEHNVNGSSELLCPLRTSPLVHRAHNGSNSSSKANSPSTGRKLPRIPPPERRILRRSPQSDLFPRFQQHRHQLESGSTSQIPFPNELIQTKFEPGADGVDPIYLALKQATGKYGTRRGSSNQYDSATPSPHNLSQVSLQDSGYAEAMGSRGHLLGSTPQLHQSSQPPASGYSATAGVLNRPRAPKLNKQMKSLSLDCAETTPPVSTGMRSQFKSRPIRQAHGFATSGETSDWERSASPTAVPSPRRLPAQPIHQASQQPATQTTHPQNTHGTHVCTHEYTPANAEFSLYLGDRLNVVDNGDPDWLHGFRTNDRLQQLLTFPSTCVAAMQPLEQPMKLLQNVHVPEAKLRFYRDQVVFAQPDSMRDNRVLVRNERGTVAYCPLQYLMLL
ncbi:hypothetical protein M3Y97_00669500 [Aphelenchoides bicaudatus]|nr:hypothetical protein M3Y97_00669500 [Aphelenchoides bicaudatus]